jgi:hypothetical protein
VSGTGVSIVATGAGETRIFTTNSTASVTAQTGAETSTAYIGSFTNHPLVIRTNDLERMRIDTSGNVLVGTTSQAPLASTGKYITLYNTANAVLSVQAVDSANDRNATLELLASGSGGTAISQIVYGDTRTVASTPSPLVFASYVATVRTERMRLDTSGNLGIGVTPSATWNSDKAIQIGDASNTSFLSSGTTSGAMNLGKNAYSVGSSPKYVGNGYATNYYQSAGTHVWQTAASNGGGAGAALTWTSAMTLDASGNLGIGTSSPGTKLDVSAADDVTVSRFRGATYALRVQSKSATGTIVDATSFNESTYQPLLIGGSQIQFMISASEKMRIDSAGSLNLSGSYTEGVVAIGNSGTAQTLSLANGTVQTVTMTGNCTFTMPTNVAGKSFILIVSSGAGGFTGTFTSVKWPNNAAPTLTTTATRWDILTFVANGSAWYGSAAQAYA